MNNASEDSVTSFSSELVALSKTVCVHGRVCVWHRELVVERENVANLCNTCLITYLVFYHVCILCGHSQFSPDGAGGKVERCYLSLGTLGCFLRVCVCRDQDVGREGVYNTVHHSSR